MGLTPLILRLDICEPEAPVQIVSDPFAQFSCAVVPNKHALVLVCRLSNSTITINSCERIE